MEELFSSAGLHLKAALRDHTRISADTAEYNTVARHVLEKCGFIQEGCCRQAIYCGGERHNQIIYGLLRTKFTKR